MPNDTLVFEQQSNHQFFTIWIDSIQASNSDTTYFMNRIPVGDYLGRDTLNAFACGYDLNSGFHAFYSVNKV